MVVYTYNSVGLMKPTLWHVCYKLAKWFQEYFSHTVNSSGIIEWSCSIMLSPLVLLFPLCLWEVIFSLVLWQWQCPFIAHTHTLWLDVSDWNAFWELWLPSTQACTFELLSKSQIFSDAAVHPVRWWVYVERSVSGLCVKPSWLVPHPLLSGNTSLSV